MFLLARLIFASFTLKVTAPLCRLDRIIKPIRIFSNYAYMRLYDSSHRSLRLCLLLKFGALSRLIDFAANCKMVSRMIAIDEGGKLGLKLHMKIRDKVNRTQSEFKEHRQGEVGGIKDKVYSFAAIILSTHNCERFRPYKGWYEVVLPLPNIDASHRTSISIQVSNIDLQATIVIKGWNLIAGLVLLGAMQLVYNSCVQSHRA